ncbi:MAG: ribonuclease HI family protein [bacterium]
MKKDTLLIYSDGGARGNPGPAAVGYVIKDLSDKTLAQAGLQIGVATNNEAEYHGIMAGLQRATGFGNARDKAIRAFLDSKLVVEQLSGRWKIKEARLAVLATQVKSLEKNFAKVTYNHIPREKNQEADSLLNYALDN